MKRTEEIEKLKDQTFDLLIIGGGITGAGIALDAMLRGYSVALVEMNDFASGTSSKSTKLIHGGLRYLKQLDFGLVMEVGRERAIVHNNALHLVHPEKMILPLIQDGNYSKWMTNLGLRVYDWLAKVDAEDKMKMLSKEEIKSHEPLLKSKSLKGGAVYAEYRTDDSRLTISVLRTAYNMGATIANYVKAESFIYEKDQVVGIKALDKLDSKTIEIRAKKTINAAGPWVDTLRSENKSLQKKKLHHTKGVHLVFDKDKLPLQQTVYFDNEDGRMIFAIPRLDRVYIGTTDTTYSGDLNDVRVSQVDADYILSAVNRVFKGEKLNQEDILSSWAGIRPLIHEEGKDPSDLSRKDEIFISKTGLISIAGGKLTGYRKMAERTLNAAFKTSEKSVKSEDQKVQGCAFKSYKKVLEFQSKLRNSFSNVRKEVVIGLVSKYGVDANEILTTSEMNSESLLLSEARFCMENEMCNNSLDFFETRSGTLYFYPKQVQESLAEVNELFAKTNGWNEKEKKEDLERVHAAIMRVTNFD